MKRKGSTSLRQEDSRNTRRRTQAPPKLSLAATTECLSNKPCSITRDMSRGMAAKTRSVAVSEIPKGYPFTNNLAAVNGKSKGCPFTNNLAAVNGKSKGCPFTSNAVAGSKIPEGCPFTSNTILGALSDASPDERVETVRRQIQEKIQLESQNGLWGCGKNHSVSLHDSDIALKMPSLSVPPIIPPTTPSECDPAAVKCVKRMALQIQVVFGSKTGDGSNKSIANTVMRIGALATYMVEQSKRGVEFTIETAIASAKYLLDQEDFSHTKCCPLVRELSAIVLGCKLLLIASIPCDDDESVRIDGAWTLGKLYGAVGWMHHIACPSCASYSLPVMLNGFVTYMYPAAPSRHVLDVIKIYEDAVESLLTCRTRAMVEAFYALAIEPMAGIQFLSREGCGTESAVLMTRMVNDLCAKPIARHVLYKELITWAAEKCVGREYEVIGLAVSMAPFADQPSKWKLGGGTYRALASTTMMEVGDIVRSWTYVWRKEDYVFVMGRNAQGKNLQMSRCNAIMNYAHDSSCASNTVCFEEYRTFIRKDIHACAQLCTKGESGPFMVCKSAVPNGKLKEKVKRWCQARLGSINEGNYRTILEEQETTHLPYFTQLVNIVDQGGDITTGLDGVEKCEPCVEQLLDNIVDDKPSSEGIVGLTSAIRDLCSDVSVVTFLHFVEILYDRSLCWPSAYEIWCAVISCLQNPALRKKLRTRLVGNVLAMTQVENKFNTQRHTNVYALANSGHTCKRLLESSFVV